MYGILLDTVSVYIHRPRMLLSTDVLSEKDMAPWASLYQNYIINYVSSTGCEYGKYISEIHSDQKWNLDFKNQNIETFKSYFVKFLGYSGQMMNVDSLLYQYNFRYLKKC